MSTLRDLQLQFANEVLGTIGTGLDAHIRSNGLAGARRLQIYRNNVLSGLTEALRAIYPVIDRLVGKPFFEHAGRQYIHRHPSQLGNLHDFGEYFADFLAILPGARELVYLPDVAHLEWAYHRVFHAADRAPLDPSRLTQVPIQKYLELSFCLHPASRLLASDYPILRVWEVNQQEYEGDQTVDLGEGGAKLLVIRRGLDVTVEPLSDGEFALLYALSQNRAFADACDAALAAEPAIDLGHCLQRHVVSSTLVDFSV